MGSLLDSPLVIGGMELDFNLRTTHRTVVMAPIMSATQVGRITKV